MIAEELKAALNERSINAKRKDVNNAINVFKKQKSGYNGIKTFGIVSAENADVIE